MCITSTNCYNFSLHPISEFNSYKVFVYFIYKLTIRESFRIDRSFRKIHILLQYYQGAAVQIKEIENVIKKTIELVPNVFNMKTVIVVVVSGEKHDFF